MAELLFTEQRLMATARPIILLAQRSLSETYYSPQGSLRIKRESKRKSCASDIKSHTGPENRAQHDPYVFLVES